MIRKQGKLFIPGQTCLAWHNSEKKKEKNTFVFPDSLTYPCAMCPDARFIVANKEIHSQGNPPVSQKVSSKYRREEVGDT